MGIAFTYEGELDASEGPSWSYTGFHRFRERVAFSIGIHLDAMEGFCQRSAEMCWCGGQRKHIPWENVGYKDLSPLLRHPDNGGEMSPEECALVWPALKESLKEWEEDDYDRVNGTKLVKRNARVCNPFDAVALLLGAKCACFLKRPYETEDQSVECAPEMVDVVVGGGSVDLNTLTYWSKKFGRRETDSPQIQITMRFEPEEFFGFLNPIYEDCIGELRRDDVITGVFPLPHPGATDYPLLSSFVDLHLESFSEFFDTYFVFDTLEAYFGGNDLAQAVFVVVGFDRVARGERTIDLHWRGVRL